MYGWIYYHPWVSVNSTSGFPDLTLVRAPTVIFAELKTEKGERTPAQEIWAAEFVDCPGVEYYLWRPSDWDAIVARLARRP